MEEKGSGCFDSAAQKILAAIRTNYLQARSPQQIQKLANLFSTKRNIASKIEADLSMGSAKSGSNQSSFVKTQGDLDKVGIMTERRNFSSTGMGGNPLNEVTPGTNRILEEDIAQVMHKLHSVTLGFSPKATKMMVEGKSLADESERNLNFLHPPVQYRIAFAKHVIKQIEFAGEWSAPQGAPEDIEYPAEQEALVLEEWYDTLEQLLSSGRVLEEQFYRLYEIKLPANHSKGESRHEIVKLFENESSFVADGTTGLVTWKAAIEFVKWLCLEDNSTVEEIKSLGNCKWALELGCGCGYLAVVLTKFLRSSLERYIATDGSLAALDRAKENVETNFGNKEDESLKSKVSYERVDWQNDETKESFTQLVDGMTSIYGTDQGLLIGTDIIFDPTQIPDLVEIIYDYIEKKAGTVLLACTVRNQETIKSFKAELGQRGLKADMIGGWEDGEIYKIA